MTDGDAWETHCAAGEEPPFRCNECTCTCMAFETLSGCDCPCEYCAEYCPAPPLDEDEDDCLDCGTCASCVERSIAYAEEMASAPEENDHA